MKICIAGWYFHPPLLIAIANSPYDAFIVKHREGNTYAVRSVVVENHGLEFGCYHHYLMNHWDGTSDVLFMQDDGEFRDLSALADIDALMFKGHIDQAFIFRDEYEEFMNAGHSGRAFWCRGSLLKKLKDSGGFAVDWSNTGNIESREANYAVIEFAKKMRSESRCGWVSIIPGLQMGRRGRLANQPYEFRRTEGQGGLMTSLELVK